MALGSARVVIVPGYTLIVIDEVERAITCARCGLTSYNLGDVANRYCVRCHVFHEDQAIMREHRP